MTILLWPKWSWKKIETGHGIQRYESHWIEVSSEGMARDHVDIQACLLKAPISNPEVKVIATYAYAMIALGAIRVRVKYCYIFTAPYLSDSR